MGTLTRTENPEDDTREEQKIRQVAEVPSRTWDGEPIDQIGLYLAPAKIKFSQAPEPDKINRKLIEEG